MDKDTSQVSSLYSLMEECMPRAAERGEDETMHSDSSVKHKKWLLAAPDAAGYPHPVHALQRLYVHACIGMQLYIVLIQHTESVIIIFRLN